jgi:predicted chitinase
VIHLPPGRIAAVTGAPAANVAAAWPLVCAALEEQGVNGPLVQAGMAATIAAETGDFLPKRERRAKDPNGLLWKAQERYWPTGFYGRGFIQITWKDNYAAAGRALGLDLVGSPDLALGPPAAARIAAWYFALHGLHMSCAARDWPNVRRGVNGPGYAKDRAALARFLRHCAALADDAASGAASRAPDASQGPGAETVGGPNG